MSPEDALAYWAEGRGLDHLTPGGDRWPEGADFLDFLRELVPDGTVTEFGCGDGRLAPAFGPERYIGVDISERVVVAAEAAQPGYLFLLISPGEVGQPSDTWFAHTVMLHQPDETLDDLVARIDADRVIISEIMGRKWRRGGYPPVYNREVSEYATLLGTHGYRLAQRIARPYKRYGGVELTVLDFQRQGET